MILDRLRAKRARSPKRRLGDLGEAAAAAYLKRCGYRVCARNVQYEGREELDIVAEDRTVRCYVEVKTRRQDPSMPARYGNPADAVDGDKQSHLRRAARRYGAAHPTRKALRFDVIEVYLSPDAEPPTVLEVKHLMDAFR